jgi:hypothetical protein
MKTKQKLVLLTVDNTYPSPVDLTPQLEMLGLSEGWSIQQLSLTACGGAVVVGVVLGQAEEPLPPAKAW